MADASEMSKSAKRRAAKKARDAAAEAEAPAPEPAPKAKAEPKAKAKAEPAPAAPKAEPKGKAKAKAKAEPAAPAAPEPKGKAKAKAKAEAKAPEPPAPEPKAKGKAKAKAEPAKAEPAPKAKAEPAPKAKGKAKAAPKAEPAPPPKPTEIEDVYVQMDDGTGGEWEVSSGLSKKAAKRQEKKAVQEMVKEGVAAAQKAAGLKPGVDQKAIPGMAPDPTKAAKISKDTQAMVDQAVARTLAAAAAAGAAAAAAAGEKGGAAAAPVEPGSTATIKVPEKKIGIVIGPKGARIKMIQEKCGGVRIDTTGEVFTITGPPPDVAQAEAAIRELIDKGYMSLEFEDFAENFVKVHPSSFPDLIGSKGAVVRKIKEELKVEVNFPDVPKTQGANATNKTYKVMLAGSNANVEKAKQVINDICMYYHHELTHPGLVHEEMDIESWAHRFIIGKGGSEMKHIQHNWQVKVNIPRDYSMNQKVVVVGEQDHVDRAKAYIEKLIYNAENQSKGRDKVDNESGDTWGDEEPVEDWMKQYMYKR